MTISAVGVRAPHTDDFGDWAALFREYRRFYRFEPDESTVERVWSWIHDPGHETRALVAVSADAALIGLAHYRRFPRPSSGTVGLFLDDLFTEPARRAAGVGRTLIGALADIAAREGCSVLRWITAADNTTAQRLYDDVATRAPWVTYDLVPLPPRPPSA